VIELHSAPGLGLTAPAALPPIARLGTTLTAFVGRTLKGPVATPTRVRDFGEFQQLFGGLWQPSMLSYAIEQYFENGGREAIIVRVVNGGQPPTVTLPAGSANLCLRGIAPGTREYLRAAVDYDGIEANSTEHFNLVVQRLRAPGTELIESQEIFSAVSVRPASPRFVADVLARSALVRVAGEVPAIRPQRTTGRQPGSVVGYADGATDADDGSELTDYDLIGSASTGTGLFALEQLPQFNLLCIPPLSRERDVGLATLLVAARICRARQALLLMDPPAHWQSTEVALRELRGWPFHSSDAVMYFPRLLAPDRLRGRTEVFAPSGAAAGLLARAEEAQPLWFATATEEPVLRAAFRAAIELTAPERLRLIHYGVNALQTVRLPAGQRLSARTLVAEGSTRLDAQYLVTRRCALFVMASVLHGTRWTVLEPPGRSLWKRLSAQVEEFLEALDAEGAFVGRSSEERYFVICDERLNGPPGALKSGLRFLFGVALVNGGDFHACLVTHLPGSSRIRPVTVNRLATSGDRVGEEIEAAIAQARRLAGAD
jgi:hypothetical protein